MMDNSLEVHRVYDVCEQGATAPCSIAGTVFLYILDGYNNVTHTGFSFFTNLMNLINLINFTNFMNLMNLTNFRVWFIN